MMRVWSLFLDAVRLPPNDGRNWKIARSHQEVVDLIELHGMPAYISFDHDLGIKHDAEETGMWVAQHLCQLDVEGRHVFPKNFNYYVHSQNPVGRANIIGYMDQYLRIRH